MADRREALELALDQAEEGTLEPPVEKDIEVPETDRISEESSKAEVSEKDNEEVAEVSTEFKSEDSDEEKNQELKTSRPTSWKKEYKDVWDKMQKGEQLNEEEFNRFANYANQREDEYKRGVSVYKAEADNAKSLTEAIGPFVSELQAQNIHPAAFISNLGRAHFALVKAPYEQKVQMFHRLAQDYGIQLNQESFASAPQAPQDPYTQQLMQQLQMMNQEVSTIKGRYEMEEQQRLNSEIERVRSNKERFPHFDMVREDMAQLLELGKAQDLETAYAKAVRMNDEAWKLEEDKLRKQVTQQASKAQQVAKAKATAISPKSATPSGSVNVGDKKDRRSILAEQLGQAMSERV